MATIFIVDDGQAIGEMLSLVLETKDSIPLPAWTDCAR